ncbi:hypothetical protein [Methylobacterium aquaticum]|uniref:hypothetical protein n=1 Tax=Methylobacterium aquaticum TaxID=270351 RepID=UPI001931BD73|nr:hypothetical protein [Methylobacterium aquaticum]QRE73125.1 hypothetical protein F1D61_05235 [Methylobacterium aquaticum]
MTMTLDATNVIGLGGVTMPKGGVGPAAAIEAETRVEDISRYRTIGSATALALAVAASLLVTGVLRLVL